MNFRFMLMVVSVKKKFSEIIFKSYFGGVIVVRKLERTLTQNK